MLDEPTKAALRKAIEQWIAEGGRTYVPYFARLACCSMPPDVSIYDDALARTGNPPISRLYLERGMYMSLDFEKPRNDDIIADYERAYQFAANDAERSDARAALAEQYASLDEYDKAIPVMYEAIALAGTRAQDSYRSSLSGWLEKRGDHAAAVAIRMDLAASAETPELKHMALKRVADLQMKAGDFAAAEETCAQMTEPFESTVDAWFELAFADASKADRAIAAVVPFWNVPAVRARIQFYAQLARGVRENLIPVLDAALFPLANAGLADSVAIEDQLLAQPEGFLVLADELTRRGDPRGELIIVQHKLETQPGDPPLVEREKQVIAENALRLLGPLHVDWVKGWRRGYVVKAEHLIGEDIGLGDLRMIGTHPSLRFLEELLIKSAPEPTNAMIEAAPVLKRIPKLVLGLRKFDDEKRAAMTAVLPNLSFQEPT